jgi:hypothetical protein
MLQGKHEHTGIARRATLAQTGKTLCHIWAFNGMRRENPDFLVLRCDSPFIQMTQFLV